MPRPGPEKKPTALGPASNFWLQRYQMIMVKTTNIHTRTWLSQQPWGLCLSFYCKGIESSCSKPPTSTPKTGPEQKPTALGPASNFWLQRYQMIMFKTTPRTWPSPQFCGPRLSFDCTDIEWSCSKPPTSMPRTWPSPQFWGLCPSFDCTGIAWLHSKPPTSTPEQDQAHSSGGCVRPSFNCTGTEIMFGSLQSRFYPCG